MYNKLVRIEVMRNLGKEVDDFISSYLTPVEKIWQPTDFLPDPSADSFKHDVEELQTYAQEMGYDLFVTLIGDCITEEALPSYESWIMGIDGVEQENRSGWSQWVRSWTAEENRHGDLLNKYLYLCGRVNMREVEITTQYLIQDGFDIGTSMDPYRNFVYTSFQETATNISHRRVGSLAKQTGNTKLSRMCGVIAADEARHAKAYKQFVTRIFELDPSEMMLAFEDMMRKKIVMPAHLMRESGQKAGELWGHFSDAAQRAMVYTGQDYINILSDLLADWKIEHISGLTEKAEKAQEYLMKLPARLQRITDRIATPDLEYQFKWVKS
ncbi:MULTISPECIES: acyl-ACP desaturase [Chryseobacterium group]|mgnify:FL=1|uniref:Acyl-ACP desaturase n=1 Tax=Kaistella yananensis TaxID=2989820 RepID=A0ABT3JNE7_9FLAO|nr:MULTISPECIES: acyl-ACP desaturase [Chryseobacterium group]MCW4452308.1 acyl-ACP desaturase [Kaistella yananensis]OWR14199.1 acyl-ACP desaturase [Chryseobacterium sp. VAUSW3]